LQICILFPSKLVFLFTVDNSGKPKIYLLYLSSTHSIRW